MVPLEQLRNLYELPGRRIRLEGNSVASRFIGGCALHKIVALLVIDEVLATAILDRLLHRSQVLNISGRSYRLRDLEQAAKETRRG